MKRIEKIIIIIKTFHLLDPDSDHRKSACPQFGLPERRCRVAGCTAKHCVEEGQPHYCSECKSKDSDHSSSNCPAVGGRGGGSAIVGGGGSACGVAGCTSCKPGQKHYCSACNNKNSDHFSKNCPASVRINLLIVFCHFCQFANICHFCLFLSIFCHFLL